ncbi:hypothetical protein NGTWS0302_14340 [Mycolicibacterium cyprinidarum]|uniref:Uncharacterized protein n=1 Tax=Mycolicibacterium cyprinidarum TaxID=2860311 RepID=A0ABQ4V415_9MYCO|nr:hypothetical protein NGTWS1702_04040 [Mycolicibacterium sp. NGTWSNA01]GJF17516.1 hypothetical protein NGTWS0302_14340 [Mycolicibacterium sp. NGTWS0302]
MDSEPRQSPVHLKDQIGAGNLIDSQPGHSIDLSLADHRQDFPAPAQRVDTLIEVDRRRTERGHPDSVYAERADGRGGMEPLQTGHHQRFEHPLIPDRSGN